MPTRVLQALSILTAGAIKPKQSGKKHQRSPLNSKVTQINPSTGRGPEHHGKQTKTSRGKERQPQSSTQASPRSLCFTNQSFTQLRIKVSLLSWRAWQSIVPDDLIIISSSGSCWKDLLWGEVLNLGLSMHWSKQHQHWTFRRTDTQPCPLGLRESNQNGWERDEARFAGDFSDRATETNIRARSTNASERNQHIYPLMPTRCIANQANTKSRNKTTVTRLFYWSSTKPSAWDEQDALTTKHIPHHGRPGNRSLDSMNDSFRMIY